MNFVVIDGCPVPAAAAGRVQEVKRRCGQSLNSCFRGSEARALLRRLGKMDQATLYNGWLRRLPGFNPANPPGNSTHECYSDGVAPPGYRRGARIPDDMVGEDWSNGPRVIQEYREMGLPAYRPYSDGREAQHVCMSKRPRRIGYFVAMKIGVKDKRVIVLKRRLAYCPRPKKEGGERYYKADKQSLKSKIFTRNLEIAVKRFQRDHGLREDGIVGQQTWSQLDGSTRYWKRRRKRARR